MPTTDKRTINLDGKIIEYSLKQSQRSRRVRVSVSESGVSLTIPYGYPPRDGEAFLIHNAEWVLGQLEKHRRHAARVGQKYLPADVILLRGVPTHIVVLEEPERKARIRVNEERGNLILRIPAGHRELIPTGLENHLREMARDQIEACVATQGRRMGVRPKSIVIRDQRTRWGSCSSSGTLSFNWRLIMVPPTVLEYVVIHELAHMIHPNHSNVYWSYVSQYYPAFKEARAWLRKNVALLHPRILTEL